MSEPRDKILIRAVLDTNVLVRGILSGRGPGGQILDAFFESVFDLVLPLSVVSEVEDVLRRGHILARLTFNQKERREVVAAPLEAAEVVSGTYRLNVVPTDAKDNHVVSAALEAGAE